MRWHTVDGRCLLKDSGPLQEQKEDSDEENDEDGIENIEKMVRRIYVHRRKSIPPKRKKISPYTSQSPVDSPQMSRFSAPRPEVLASNKPSVDSQRTESRPEVSSKPEVRSKPEVSPKAELIKTETNSKSSFKLHQPKAFGKNSVLEKKISELHHQKQSSEATDKSIRKIGEEKSAKKQADDLNVSQYLENLQKNTINTIPDKPVKISKKKSDKSTSKKPDKPAGKLKLGSPGKIQKMKNLRRSPRKPNPSSSFAQTFGLSVISHTKLPGRIPKKKKN